jgi:large subunit ribosomal protein L18
MRANKIKMERRRRRKRGIRKRLCGDKERPRLSVFRSLKHIYAQIIDDDSGATLCEASTRSRELRERIKDGGNAEAAKIVGTVLAERAKVKDIQSVRFDRSGYRFHGRVKSLAEAVREGGLRF